MSAALSPCVKALVRAAVYGCQHKDEGCVRATLSALWNLASHSMENKRAICDEPGCLHMLASLLTANTNQTVIVESASGILKYASVYLSTTSSHLEERSLLVNGLIQLLVSASFTISCNALGALSNLIAKDPHLQAFIRSNGSAMHQLNSLRDSARDDIRAAVKSVLNHLNQPAGFIRSNEMSTSMGVGYDVFRDSGRLLPLRSMRASPGATNLSSFTSPRSIEQRSSSLPRHFVRGGSIAMHGSTHASPSHYLPTVINQTSDEHDRLMMQQVNEDEIRHNNMMNDDDEEEDDNDFADDFERDTMSATCNRSNASRQSLETEHTNQSGWASMLDTANNSARLSPVSPSELPDSPTHYTLVRQQNLMNAGKQLEIDASLPLRVNVMSSDAGGKSNFSSSDAATAVVDDQPTPTFTSCRISQTVPIKQNEMLKNTDFSESFDAENESDYAVLEGNSELLDRSIEAAYPQSSSRLEYKASPSHAVAFQVTNGMSGTSSPRKSTESAAMDRERLLNECILSAMPAAGVIPGFSSKNEMGGPTLVTRLVRHQTGRLQDSNCVDENIGESNGQDSSFKNGLITQDSVSSEESDDFFCKNDFDDLDTSLPLDCLEEPMTIDCSSLRSSSSSGDSKSKSVDSSSTSRKTRLPMPTSKVLQSSNCRSAQISVKPKIGPKPLHSQAVVPPFNYQKPMHVNDESSGESAKSGNMHSNTMLVTTV